jgi:hypothetical protein
MTDLMTKACSACLTTIDASATRCSSCTQRQPDPGLSRGVRRHLAVDLMREAIGPILRFILLKEKALAHRGELLKQQEDLMERLRGARQLADIQYRPLTSTSWRTPSMRFRPPPLPSRARGLPSGISSGLPTTRTLGARSRRATRSRPPSAPTSRAQAARRGTAARQFATNAGAASTTTPLL